MLFLRYVALADYDKAKEENTRRIAGSGLSREDLDDLSRKADRALDDIVREMEGQIE